MPPVFPPKPGPQNTCLEWRSKSFLTYRYHDWQASRDTSISWLLGCWWSTSFVGFFSPIETTFRQILLTVARHGKGFIFNQTRSVPQPCHPRSLSQSGSTVTFLPVSLPLITWRWQSHKGTGFGSFSVLLQMLKGCQGQQLEAGTVARSKRLSVRLWFE